MLRIVFVPLLLPTGLEPWPKNGQLTRARPPGSERLVLRNYMFPRPSQTAQ